MLIWFIDNIIIDINNQINNINNTAKTKYENEYNQNIHSMRNSNLYKREVFSISGCDEKNSARLLLA